MYLWFLIKSQKIEGTFSVREIHIYAIYLNLLCKVNPKEKEEVISRFYQLMQYVNVHYVEEQQKVRIYPLLVCLWGNLVIEGKDTEGSFEIFEKHLNYCENKNRCIVYWKLCVCIFW